MDYQEIDYETFKNMKMSFNDITYKLMVQLWCISHISDSIIAEKCGVSKGKVTYLRKNKYDIHQYDIYKHLRNIMNVNPKLREEANAIVAYSFRNGFLEDLHAGRHSKILESKKFSRITDLEMKKLMIECCDKMEELLRMKQEDSDRYKLFITRYNKSYCSGWKK